MDNTYLLKLTYQPQPMIWFERPLFYLLSALAFVLGFLLINNLI